MAGYSLQWVKIAALEAMIGLPHRYSSRHSLLHHCGLVLEGLLRSLCHAQEFPIDRPRSRSDAAAALECRQNSLRLLARRSSTLRLCSSCSHPSKHPLCHRLKSRQTKFAKGSVQGTTQVSYALVVSPSQPRNRQRSGRAYHAQQLEPHLLAWTDLVEWKLGLSFRGP